MDFRGKLFEKEELNVEKSRHIYWRQIVFIYLVMFLLFGGLPLVIIGALLFIQEAYYLIAFLQSSIYFGLMIILFQKKISYNMRVNFAVYSVNLVAYILLFMTGSKGAWIVFVLMALCTAGFLFEANEIIILFVINLVVMILASTFIVLNLFPSLSIHEYRSTWMVTFTSVILVGFTIVFVIFKTIGGIRIQGNLAIEREQYLEASIRSSHDGLVICDNLGNITNINPSAKEIFGKDTMIVGKHVDQVFHFIDSYSLMAIPEFDELLKTQKGVITHVFYETQKGEKISITLSYATITNKSNQDIGMIFSIHDITKQKLMEERLKQTQKLQAMGTLAGGVAHDFNNMLGGILGYAQLLESLNSVNQDAKKVEMGDYITEIQKTVEKASELTRQLLAYARKEEIQYIHMSVHSCIKSAVRLLNRTIDKRISIMLNLTEDDDIIFGDMTMLQNVFLNLCINARDAMPNGGQLIIQTRSLCLNEVFCMTHDFELIPGEYIQIVFSDTGSGIESKFVTKIFEPFFTTKGVGEGTGLGLSESYGTVVAHGGAIIVNSEQGMGTEFTIYLPKSGGEVAKAADKIVESKKAAVVNPKLNKTILLIDDEPVMRSVVEIYFRNLGFNVLIAENGQEGIHIYEKQYQDIDVVLLDMIMPKLTGSEVFHKMKIINEDVKVIVLSGFVDESKISTLLQEGVVGYFKKPFRLEDIEDKINQC